MSFMQNYGNLLRNPRFLALWSGSFLSGIGDAVITVSLVWMIYQKTGSPLLLSLTLICLEFPKFLAAPVFGVMLDRYPALVFTVLSNVISGCLFLFLILIPLDSAASYAGFLLLIALSSSLAPVTKAASNIIVTETVEQDRLITANSLMNIQFDLALSLGPVAGGVLMAVGHMTSALLFNAATFFVAAGLYYVAMPPHAKTRRRQAAGEMSLGSRYAEWKKDLTHGFSFLFGTRVVRSVVLANFLWNFLIWGTSAALLPLFSDQRLAAGAGGYGLLTAMLSIGIVIGSFVTGAWKVEKSSLKSLVFLSMALHGLTYALLSLPHHLSAAVTILVLCGVVSSPAIIYNRTFMQLIVPKELMGRVFTVSGALGALGYPLGTTLAASSASVLGVEHIAILFALLGGTTSLLMLWLWRSTRRSGEIVAAENLQL